ncbi:spore germination protein GerW family protein [Streptomyces sp. NBC_01304]|uniref:spore germination protein GerW family protein n=1 Tax=Streptomyces sp. NBC_01304 TaxID=2903818 RepID=UPI002E10D6B9|nr:spore germination protein GerW family protein [Streptomyces sp. NBC_01304]
MTSPPAAGTPRPPQRLSAAHASVALLEALAEKLGGRASVTAVYGEPVTRDDVTVIPVAQVGFGFGGGAGQETGTDKSGEGGGGGGGGGAKPLGFIVIRGGDATYRPIRDPWVQVVLPLAGLLAGTALPRIARALTHRARHH